MNKFPGNKPSTVENISPVYHLLAELGMRTTKSVWPLLSAALVSKSQSPHSHISVLNPM
jgi:hypothetical protein